MPTRALPGIGASIRMGWLAKAKARSLERVVIFDNFMPSAGFKVYWVTVGPTFISDISTGISKFSRVFLIMAELILMSPANDFSFSESNNSRAGFWYSSPPPLVIKSTGLVFNSKGGSSETSFSFLISPKVVAGGSISFTLKEGG